MDDHPLSFRRLQLPFHALSSPAKRDSRLTASNADFDFKIVKLELIILFCLCDLPLDAVFYGVLEY